MRRDISNDKKKMQNFETIFLSCIILSYLFLMLRVILSYLFLTSRVILLYLFLMSRVLFLSSIYISYKFLSKEIMQAL